MPRRDWGGRTGVDGEAYEGGPVRSLTHLTGCSGSSFSVVKTDAPSHRERELGTEGP